MHFHHVHFNTANPEADMAFFEKFVDSTTTIDYSGNRIAGFPGVSGRIAAAYRVGRGRVELAVEHGYPPEHVLMVLYASTENAEILRMMAEQGFFVPDA